MKRILCAVLVVVLAFSVFGCGKSEVKDESAEVKQETGAGEAEELGKGDTEITVHVVGKDKTEKTFLIHTDKETLLKALLENDLIDGVQGNPGFMVLSVCGEEAIYEEDGSYWAFYIGEDYAMVGVDSTLISDGDEYSFKVEK